MTRSLCVRAVAAALASSISAVALADGYRFVRIADTRDDGFVLDSSRHAAINNAGTVVLYKTMSGFVSGYFSGTGGPLSTIVTNESGPLAGLGLYRPSLNDSGQIAFYGEMATLDGFRVYRADPGGAITLIASSGVGTFGGFVPNVSLNNSGNVAFTSASSLYIGNGSGNTQLYPLPGDGVTSAGSGPSNNSGTVSFAGSYPPSGGAAIAYLKGAGGGATPSVIASNGINDISSASESVINDGGLVVFGTTRFSAPTQGIFTGAGGSVITTVVDLAGPYSDLATFHGTGAGGFPTLNNTGTIAFAATLDSGDTGIFTGADPETSRVIQTGSTLFGRDFQHALGGLGREAINDSGEIVFQAQLLDGMGFSDAIVKAIPSIAMKWEDDSDGVWSDDDNWLGPIPSAFHHDANFTDAITAPRTVTVDGAFTVGSINFDNANRYTINGSGAITLDDSFSGRIGVVSGSHVINAPLVMPRSATIDISAGAELKIANPLPAEPITLTKVGGGALQMKNYRVKELAVNGGEAQVLSGGGVGGTSVVENLSIAGGTGAWTARFDVNDSRAIVEYEMFLSPIDQVADQLKQGYAAGAWTGNGIASAAAAADVTGRTGVGFAEAADALGAGGGIFGGVSVDDTSLLIAYTLNGDTDLNRTVDIGDFARLAANFNLPGAWSGGDFNYDGLIDIGDFAGLAANFNQSLAIDLPRASMLSETSNSVPEPGEMMLLLPLLHHMRRRRK